MTIERTQRDGATILTLSGRLDTITAPQLQEVLIPALEGGAKVVLDFAGLAYVSSAGLRVLLLGQKAATARGAAMALTGVSAEIMEVFDMTGFTDMLTIS